MNKVTESSYRNEIQSSYWSEVNNRFGRLVSGFSAHWSFTDADDSHPADTLKTVNCIFSDYRRTYNYYPTAF